MIHLFQMKLLASQIKRGTGVILLLVFLFSGCENHSSIERAAEFVYTGRTMGTTFSVKAKVVSTIDKTAVQQDIDELLILLNQQMSTYISDSELSLFNKSQSTEWMQISKNLFAVLKKSREVYDLSGMVFDPTISPLINLWGFGTDPTVFDVPSEEKIEAAQQLMGMDKVELDEMTGVRKKHPQLSIDLSAVAKGFAVDKVAELMESKGLTDYMVEIGGEIRLKGHNFDDKKWKIAIEKPVSDMRSIQKVLPLTDISMATSGDYRNFFEKDGRRFSHTIDPVTGYPINHALASVTVLHKSCMDADAWATALMVLGQEKGFEVAQKNGLAAFFISKNAAEFEEKSTHEFKQLTGEK